MPQIDTVVRITVGESATEFLLFRVDAGFRMFMEAHAADNAALFLCDGVRHRTRQAALFALSLDLGDDAKLEAFPVSRCNCGHPDGEHHPNCDLWDSHVDGYGDDDKGNAAVLIAELEAQATGLTLDALYRLFPGLRSGVKPSAIEAAAVLDRFYLALIPEAARNAS